MAQSSATKRKFSYASAILSIAMVLLMLGLFGFLVLASGYTEKYLKENMIISVFMNPETTEDVIRQAEQTIRSQPFTHELVYISKERAATDFSNELGQDFISFLGFNPLMASFQVKVNADYHEMEKLEETEKFLKSVAGVAEVSYQRMAYEEAKGNIRKLGYVFIGLALIFTLVAIILIHNTIRLNLYARRFIIKSMQLVGATHWFIIKPYIIRSVINGLWGWLIAVILLISISQSVPALIPEWAQVSSATDNFILYGLLLIAGMVISVISSFISTRKFLNTRLEDLY